MIDEKYVCTVCGYEYDPEVGDPDNGIAPGTAFEDLPEDWVCPLCGVGKDLLRRREPASQEREALENGSNRFV